MKVLKKKFNFRTKRGFSKWKGSVGLYTMYMLFNSYELVLIKIGLCLQY